MDYLLVAVGGMFGSLSRFLIGKKIAEKASTSFPIGTFFINLTGALLLGVVNAGSVNRDLYILLGVGFFGAYSTFSTFMYEGFHLFRENERLNAFVYVLSSLILGVIGYAMGFALTKFIGAVYL